MTAVALHPRLQEIVGDFDAVPGTGRLQLLLKFSGDLPPLPGRYAAHHDLLEPVPECQTPLFLAVEIDPDATAHLFFGAPPEAPATRGFAGILRVGAARQPPEALALLVTAASRHSYQLTIVSEAQRAGRPRSTPVPGGVSWGELAAARAKVRGQAAAMPGGSEGKKC